MIPVESTALGIMEIPRGESNPEQEKDKIEMIRIRIDQDDYSGFA